MEPFTKQQLADFLGVQKSDIDRGDDSEVIASYLATHGYEMTYRPDGSITAYRNGEEITQNEIDELMAACRNERPL